MLGPAWIANSVPEGVQRDEIAKLVDGDRAAADAAHLTNLLFDPRGKLERTLDTLSPSEKSVENLKAREPANVLEEFERMAPDQIKAARAAFEKEGHGTWDDMIRAKFAGDHTTCERMLALAHGDRAEDKALALREGMREHDQATIEAALASPDLTSADPKRKAAAEAERRAVLADVRALDRGSAMATAALAGRDPTKELGRDASQQVEAYYGAAPDEPLTLNPMELQRRYANRHREELARADGHVATKELLAEGKLSTATEFYRADSDTERASIVDGIHSNEELHRTEAYLAKNYRGNEMFEAPELGVWKLGAQVEQNRGDTRPIEEIERDLARGDLDAEELKLDNVRRYGVRAERSVDTEDRLQHELKVRQHSDRLARRETERSKRGGATGTEELAREQLAAMDDQLEPPKDPFGLMERGLRAGASREEFDHLDSNLTQTLETQRDEKQKYGSHLAKAVSTIGKLAAIATGQPELFALLDVVSGMGAMAIKRSVENEAYDGAEDAKLLAIEGVVDVMTVGVASAAGAGAKVASTVVGETAAAGASKVGEQVVADVIEDGVTSEVKAQIVEQGARAAGETEVASQAANAAASSGTASAAEIAAKTESAAAGSAAKAIAIQTAGNLGANAVGSIASGLVEGQSPTEILGNLVKGGLAMLLPGHLGAQVQSAIGDATAAQRILQEIASIGTELGTNLALNDGEVADAAVNVGGGKIAHHAGHPGEHEHGRPAHEHAAQEAEHARPAHEEEAHAQRRAVHEEEARSRGEETTAAHEEEPSRPHQTRGGDPEATARPHPSEEHAEPATEHPREQSRHEDEHRSPASRRVTEGRGAASRHPGTDLHSHFMGVATSGDMMDFIGEKQLGRSLTSEEMLAKMQEAVRKDTDYALLYNTDEHGNKTFDETGAHKGEHRDKKAGDAFENVGVIERAQAEIAELRKQPSTPETEARIAELASGAVDRALTASQETPFDGAYSIRDTLVKEYIDPRPEDGKAYKGYENYTRMTIEALARDGVLYSEQSQSVKKLQNGSFPPEMVKSVLEEVNADRAKNGEPPVDMRFLAMVEGRYLGPAGGERSGTDAQWNEQVAAARGAMKRGDVIGLDFAGPELTKMGANGGEQAVRRFGEMATMLREEGNAAGRKLVLRPHVGEGYVEMPVDPATGKPRPFERDANREHYKTARDNIEALVDSVDQLSKQRGPDGKPVYDPKDPNPEIRFGHVTHATPELAKRMHDLGIVAEVNLGSNAISGSLQDNPNHPAGRDEAGRLRSFEDHSLLVFAAEGTTTILNTDGQSVMNTTMEREYLNAKQILGTFRGDPGRSIAPKGTMPVTRETYLAAHPEADPATAQPPFELGYSSCPQR